MLEFEVIPNEQTPATQEIKDPRSFISKNSEIIEEFKKYAESRDDAIGLAANQCSLEGERILLRMCAIKDSKDPDRKCTIAIDPIITRSYGMKRFKFEGCLTWKGGMVVVAERSHNVDVKYYTPEGDIKEETYKGFQAQVWQHEINHLNGIEEKVVSRYNLPKLPTYKIGRNDPCPCGSGKKYKKCCIEI